MSVLSHVKQEKEPSILALLGITMRFEVRSIEEQDNFDHALFNLIRAGSVIQFKDENGFTSYKLAA